MVMGEQTLETDVLVIGGGPGGYAAAFRAADLGLDVTMVDIEERPGGVCLFRGCIPSKTFLYLAELIHDAGRSAAMGIHFSKPEIDLQALRSWKKKVVDKLSGGLVSLSEGRNIQRIQGRAVFESPDTVRVGGMETVHIRFRNAVIATGSSPTPLSGVEFVEGGRIMDSSGALELTDIPETLLVVGAGYVGLELGSVYAALGSRVTLVEMGKRILPGVDEDLARPLAKRLEASFHGMYFGSSVDQMTETEAGVEVTFSGGVDPARQRFGRALVAVGRRAATADLGLEAAGVKTDQRGFVVVDDRMRTSRKGIFAVGDVVGGAMLAHKATYEGKIAAEVIAGKPAVFDARAIPAVVYTDPQVAWCGLTEQEARKKDIPYEVQRFPWKFSGRALTMDAAEGMTKILADPETKRILGVGIVGRNTEGMISEGTLAMEMGALAEDMALTIHPHPTLSETEGEAAEIFLGSATHMLSRRTEKG
ncbi:MAG: dihydrolipoyl dehydrogenase [Desulfobacterales bacterium]|jgi:dihydrolipoamide dehydrogenase